MILLVALLGYAGPLPASAGGPPPDPETAFEERLEVELRTITVRVVDGRGEPVPGLGRDDFIVRTAGDEIPVEAVDWVSAEGRGLPAVGSAPSEPVDTGSSGVGEPLILFFVQAGRHEIYRKGAMQSLPWAEELLESLPAESRVAVVSFDSHLKVRQDLTRNRESVRRALRASVRFGAPVVDGDGAGEESISLGRSIGAEEARRAATPEAALRLVGRALAPIPGPKSMVFLGWGLGRFGRRGVRMTPEYARARRALVDSDTSVFVLDLTDAGHHSLEVGLEKISAETGGTYAKTSLFPEGAVTRLARTLSAHYVLSLDARAWREARGPLSIEVDRSDAVVLAPRRAPR